jgi:hypothetical protein
VKNKQYRMEMVYKRLRGPASRGNETDGANVIPPPGRPEKMNELLGQRSTLDKLRDADVIFGVDEGTGNEFLVFGRDLIQEIADSTTTRCVLVVRVPILPATRELEALLAITEGAKGHHEYR